MPKLTLIVYHPPRKNQMLVTQRTDYGLRLNLNTVLMALFEIQRRDPANGDCRAVRAKLKRGDIAGRGLCRALFDVI